MTDYNNPMLDDDEEGVTPIPQGAPKAREPKFGEKGFGLGKPKPHKGSPRSHVTANDAPLLAFLNEVQVADAATCALVLRTKPNQNWSSARTLSPRTMEDKLRRLHKLGVVQNAVSRDDRQTTLWGVTEAGIASAMRFGYLQDEASHNVYNLGDIARKHQNHMRAIGMVAANFLAGRYEESLDVPEITVDHLISEARIRRESYEPHRRSMQDKTSFAVWRNREIKAALQNVANKKVRAEHLLDRYPEFRTIGQQNSEGSAAFKDAHWPDLVIDLDRDARSPRGTALLIEVELSNKKPAELRAIISTIAKELENSVVYKQAVYFVSSPAIAKNVQAADRELGTNLMGSGRLKIAKITDPSGELFTIKTTIAD